MKNEINKKFKVAFVGNIGNNFFREVGGLRKYTSIEADLFFDNSKDAELLDRPDLENNNYKNKFPKWIKTYKKPRFFEILLNSISKINIFLSKDTKLLISELEDYDLCVFSGNAIPIINMINNKKIIRPTGSDLTTTPVLKFREYSELRDNSLLERIKSFHLWFLKKRIYINSYKNADLIAVDKYKPFLDAITKLRLKYKITETPRLAIDTNNFKRINASYRSKVFQKWNIPLNSFIIFFPARIMIKNSNTHVKTGQWKASEKVFFALKRVLNNLNNYEKKKIILLIPFREESPCYRNAMSLIKKHNLSKNVMILKGDKVKTLTRPELIDIFSISSVTLDDFGAGWYGSNVVESLSCQCPVITYVDEKYLKEHFKWHPIMNAQYADEIAKFILNLFHDHKFLNNLRKKSHKWVKEYHSEKSISYQYIFLIKNWLKYSD